MPHNVREVLDNYDKILVCEMNSGQLRLILNGRFDCKALGLNKIQGKPFTVAEVTAKIDELLGGKA